MFDPDTRTKWDKNIKTMTIYNSKIGNLELNNKCYLVNILCNSPVAFISERDVLDKRIEFEDKGVIYNYTSSIDEKVKYLIL